MLSNFSNKKSNRYRPLEHDSEEDSSSSSDEEINLNDSTSAHTAHLYENGAINENNKVTYPEQVFELRTLNEGNNNLPRNSEYMPIAQPTLEDDDDEEEEEVIELDLTENNPNMNGQSSGVQPTSHVASYEPEEIQTENRFDFISNWLGFIRHRFQYQPAPDEPTDANNSADQPDINLQPTVLYMDRIHDVNDEEDDPFCHQALLFFGVCCCYPFLWVFGAILWCVTPKSHRRSRKWGLSNLILSIFFFLYLLVKLNTITEPQTQEISYFEKSLHMNPLLPNEVLHSGTLSTNHNKYLVVPRNIQEPDWIPLIFEPTSERVGKISKSQTGLYTTTNGHLGPEFSVIGRFILETKFLGHPSLDSQKNEFLNNINYPESILKETAWIPVSGFPWEHRDKYFSIVDTSFPTDLLGSALKCQIANKSTWFIQWLTNDNKASGDMVSDLLYFEQPTSCRIAVFNTFTNSSTSSHTSFSPLDFIQFIRLRSLPGNT